MKDALKGRMAALLLSTGALLGGCNTLHVVTGRAHVLPPVELQPHYKPVLFSKVEPKAEVPLLDLVWLRAINWYAMQTRNQIATETARALNLKPTQPTALAERNPKKFAIPTPAIAGPSPYDLVRAVAAEPVVNLDKLYNSIQKTYAVDVKKDNTKMQAFKQMKDTLNTALKRNGYTEKEIKQFYILQYLGTAQAAAASGKPSSALQKPATSVLLASAIQLPVLRATH